MFSSILGHRALQSLVHGYPDSVRHGVALVACLSSGTSLCLDITTRSAPPLHQHVLQTRQIVGRKFNNWVGVLS